MNRAQIITTLGRLPGLSHLLRRLANNFSEGSVVNIRSGLARGARWKRHHRYVNGYWVGHYEMDIQNALWDELSPAQSFWDIGCNAGFFTLLAGIRVGQKGSCTSVDPLPENILSVAEQMELNPVCDHVAIQAAVGETDGSASFCFSHSGDSQAHFAKGGESGTLTVQVLTLDTMASAYGVPHFIKMDIEGAEGSALRGASNLLRSSRPGFLIELHGKEAEREVRRILLSHDYQFEDLKHRPLAATEDLPHHIIAKPKK